MLHLDTNFVILALQHGTPEESLLHGWIGSNEKLGVSAVAWAEFLCGPLDVNARALAQTVFPMVEPLLPSDAEKGAELLDAVPALSQTA